MSIRRYQLRYGTLWGAAAFLVGFVATYLITPPLVVSTNAEVKQWAEQTYDAYQEHVQPVQQ